MLVLQLYLAIGLIGCDIVIKTGHLLTEGCHYIIVALADRYVARPLPLRRDKNLELLER